MLELLGFDEKKKLNWGGGESFKDTEMNLGTGMTICFLFSFFFSSDFSFNSELLKKKNHMQDTSFSRFNGNNNGALN